MAAAAHVHQQQAAAVAAISSNVPASVSCSESQQQQAYHQHQHQVHQQLQHAVAGRLVKVPILYSAPEMAGEDPKSPSSDVDVDDPASNRCVTNNNINDAGCGNNKAACVVSFRDQSQLPPPSPIRAVLHAPPQMAPLV